MLHRKWNIRMTGPHWTVQPVWPVITFPLLPCVLHYMLLTDPVDTSSRLLAKKVLENLSFNLQTVVVQRRHWFISVSCYHLARRSSCQTCAATCHITPSCLTLKEGTTCADCPSPHNESRTLVFRNVYITIIFTKLGPNRSCT